MTHRLTTQAAALSLSLMATLAMLTGMNALASQPHHETLAAAESTTQVVIVTGKRLGHG